MNELHELVYTSSNKKYYYCISHYKMEFEYNDDIFNKIWQSEFEMVKRTTTRPGLNCACSSRFNYSYLQPFNPDAMDTELKKKFRICGFQIHEYPYLLSFMVSKAPEQSPEHKHQESEIDL